MAVGGFAFEVADGDAAGLAEAEGGGGFEGVGADAGFDAQDVGGAAGEGGEGGVAADHPVGDFVDGAVAAEDDDPFRALGDLLLGEGAGGARAGGGAAFDGAVGADGGDGAFDEAGVAEQLARPGVINECDGRQPLSILLEAPHEQS